MVLELETPTENTDADKDKLSKNKEFIALADASYKQKNYEDSIKNYQEALKLNPSDEITLLKIGNIYKLKDDEKMQ